MVATPTPLEAYHAATEAWQKTPTDETKAAAAAALEVAKKADVEARKVADASRAPEKYTLVLPKDSSLKPENLQAVEAFAKANKLTQTQAQAFLERESQSQAERDKQFGQVKENWLKETMADKEIGGDNLKAAAEGARRVLDKFGDDSLKKDLDSTGLGNHPGLVRFLHKVFKSMSDDQLVGGSGQVTDAPKSTASILFPKSLAAAEGRS